MTTLSLKNKLVADVVRARMTPKPDPKLQAEQVFAPKPAAPAVAAPVAKPVNVAYATINLLAAMFPRTFAPFDHTPLGLLKIGIFEDLRAELPELGKHKLKRVLHCYCNNPHYKYLASLPPPRRRVDLRGEITIDEKVYDRGVDDRPVITDAQRKLGSGRWGLIYDMSPKLQIDEVVRQMVAIGHGEKAVKRDVRAMRKCGVLKEEVK